MPTYTTTGVQEQTESGLTVSTVDSFGPSYVYNLHQGQTVGTFRFSIYQIQSLYDGGGKNPGSITLEHKPSGGAAIAADTKTWRGRNTLLPLYGIVEEGIAPKYTYPNRYTGGLGHPWAGGALSTYTGTIQTTPGDYRVSFSFSGTKDLEGFPLPFSLTFEDDNGASGIRGSLSPGKGYYEVSIDYTVGA